MAPLVAFHCPDNEFKWVKIEDCERCEDRCLPIEMVRLIWDTEFTQKEYHYHNDPDVISVTSVLNAETCLRESWYNKKRDYAEPPPSFIARSSSTLLHGCAEAANPAGEGEVLLSVITPGGIKIFGTADIVTSEYIADYKKMQAARKTHGVKDIEQLNAYEQMARRKDGIRRKRYVYQWGHKNFAVHEVPEDDGVLDEVMARADILHAALKADDVTMVESEGRDKHYKFDSKPLCHYCPHSDECAEVEDE